MNEFAIWFYRPIAEFLGTLALIAGLLLVLLFMFGLFKIYSFITGARKKRNARRSANV